MAAYILFSLLWIYIFSDNELLLESGNHVLQLSAPLLASIWLFGKYKTSTGKFRKIWLFPCTANISYFVAMSCFMYYDYFLKIEPPFPGSPDFFWLLMNGLYLLTFIYFTYLDGKSYRAFQLVFDAVIVMIAASALSWEFLIKDFVSDSADQSFLYILVYVGYPVSDLAILFGILMLFYIKPPTITSKSLSLMFFGMLIFLIGDSYYLFLVFNDLYQFGNYVDVSWTSGILIFALASFEWEQEDREKEAAEPKRSQSNHFFSIRLWLPYFSILILAAVVLYKGEDSKSLIVGLILSFLIVIFRQIHTLVENNLLLEKSSHANKHLEIQVEQRTKELYNKNQELEKLIKKAEYFAYHDLLTGLPNRRFFEITLQQKLNMNNKEKRVGVLFLDLDRFKLVNDTLGHAVGDLLLRQVAIRLKKIVKAEGSIYRQGGDEFLILLPHCSEQTATQIADKIVVNLAEAFQVREHEIFITSSIGLSFSPDHGKEIDMLIKRADTALYAVKENGKNSYQIFTQDLDDMLKYRTTLENGLRTAIEYNEFFLHYQPKLEIKTGEIKGMEALLRWKHPTLGMVSPAVFIPVAEEIGLINKIGNWVLEEATRQSFAWQQKGMPQLQLSVNVSALQFLQMDFFKQLVRILQKTKLDPHFLELEVTESIMHQSDHAIEILKCLRGIGIKISVDDFGSGYSSLNQIRHIPLDILKIDKGFIDDIVSSRKDQAIVKVILALGKNLGLTIVAEGVENEDQLTYLIENGCDEIQGYLISRPLAVEEFEKFLSQRSNFYRL